MNDMPERLPSRPLRNWFLAWHIHTGDPADVIAKGFDLDPVLVAAFLSGEVPLMLRSMAAIEICRSLRLSALRLWGSEVAARDPWVAEPVDPDLERLTEALSVLQR